MDILDDIHVEESLSEQMSRNAERLKNYLPFSGKSAVVVSACIEGLVCSLLADEFDSLIEFFFIERKRDETYSRFELTRCSYPIKAGFMEFIKEPLVLENPVVTTAATGKLRVTKLGRLFIKNAGLVALAGSSIRLGLFSLLDQLLSYLKPEYLPMFLTHKDERVQKLARARLNKEERHGFCRSSKAV